MKIFIRTNNALPVSVILLVGPNVNYLETTGLILTIVLENSTMLCIAHDNNIIIGVYR